MRKLGTRNLIAGTLVGLVLGAPNVHAGNELQFKNQHLQTNSVAAKQGLFRKLNVNEDAKIFVVQFKSAIGLNEQTWLKNLNVEVLRYVPEDAYITRIQDKRVLDQLNRDPRVQIVVPFAPELRVNVRSLMMSVFNQNETKELHVRAFVGENFAAIHKSLAAIPNVEVIAEENGAFIVRAPVGAAEAIAQIEGVEWVDLYNRPQVNKMNVRKMMGAAAKNLDLSIKSEGNELTGFESGTKVMKLDVAWKNGLTGSSEVITVADTGLDTGVTSTLNKDFAGLKRTYIGGYFSKTWGDPNGHGTHVAGSAVGRGLSSNGKLLGAAYGASLVFEAMWSESLGNLTIPPDPSKLFEVAYTRDGSRIHTNSWGGSSTGEYDDGARAVDEFMWDHPDMVILFAAGNSGVDADRDGRVDPNSVSSPGTAKNIISVGASENLVENIGLQVKLGTVGSEAEGFPWPAEPIASDKISDNINGLAAFSSRGPTNDGRLKPDIVAPGTNILSNCSKYEGADHLWGQYNDDLCFSGGTSMSTPLVAGAAAIVRQYLMHNRRQAEPSSSLIKGILMHSAFDMYPGQFGAVGETRGQELLTAGPNADQGYGRVDMDAATQDSIGFVDDQKGVGTGQESKINIAGSVKKVTLVYTDAPGSTSVDKALVNDLDLQVVVGGRTYEKASRLDNSEQVILPRDMSNAVVIVKGKNVPLGRNGLQPFAVIYSR